jgi:RNA polymerase sigma-70 factor, ECF subfamily
MSVIAHSRDDRQRPSNGKGDRLRPTAGQGDESFSNPDTATSPAPPGTAYHMRPTVTDSPDETLLEQYRHGDRASFRTLVDRYHRELYHFLVRFLGDRVAAEDVFQETFLQVHQSAEQFDVNRRFRPWLFTIAANKARDLIRSQARRPTNPLQASIGSNDAEGGEFIDLMQSTAEQPSEPMERQELQQLVQNTVMGMPDNLREILLLSYFHQFPYKQISDILGIPLGTVKSRLHAAVAYFADRWRGTNQNTSLS